VNFPVLAERAVNFVRGYLNETPDAVFPRGIEEDARADNIGVNEILGGIDAAVDMRLGREIDHRKKPVLEHERVDRVSVSMSALKNS